VPAQYPQLPLSHGIEGAVTLRFTVLSDGLVLDQVLRGGLLSRPSPVGITIGVVRDGDRRVFTFGKAQPDEIFEIGSITKTFTGLLLALAIEQGKVKSDTPIRELLPQGTVAKPASGGEITLLDLATQHSGLPRMPDNFQPKD